MCKCLFMPTLLIFFNLIIFGCVTGSAIVTGKARPAIKASFVKIYIDPPHKYETLGIVEASSDIELSSQAAQDRVIVELKRQAARIGANGIILLSTGEKRGDMVGFYSGNLFIAGTEETKTAKGKAIYVEELGKLEKTKKGRNLNKSSFISSIFVLKISDGDTLEVGYRGVKERVRLIGIDAPEITMDERVKLKAETNNQDLKTIIPKGKKAKNFVMSLVKPKDTLRIEFDVQQRDRYGRLLGYVYLQNGKMLNEEILKAGYANLLTISPNVKYVKRFKKAYKVVPCPISYYNGIGNLSYSGNV